MATRRRSIHTQNNSGLNFRPTDTRTEFKGTRPTSEPQSVKEVITLIVLHGCRRSIFFDTNLKVALYLGALFVVSLIADFAPIPRSYLSKSSNVFNQYFVKLAWGWNLMLLIPYVTLTAYVYCCAKFDQIVKHHLSRLVIATFFWWFWTSLFQYIEVHLGRCSMKTVEFGTKQACLKGGHLWHGFDISGHSFILIYGSLLFVEEAKSVINWDSIKEYIRLEQHSRDIKDKTPTNNPLRNLSAKEFNLVKDSYEKYTVYIRALFISITLLQILWDVMLVSTMLYFHVMIEKFIGGAIAILTWFFTYRFWYRLPYLPKMPGEGAFKYIREKSSNATGSTRRRTGSIVGETSQLPKFMGMPLYGLKVENGTSSTPNEDISLR